jgi:hypothetical protein
MQVLLGFSSPVTLGSKSRRTWRPYLTVSFETGSLFIASYDYDSQGYGGGILTRLQTGQRKTSLVEPLDELDGRAVSDCGPEKMPSSWRGIRFQCLI